MKILVEVFLIFAFAESRKKNPKGVTITYLASAQESPEAFTQIVKLSIGHDDVNLRCTKEGLILTQ